MAIGLWWRLTSPMRQNPQLRGRLWVSGRWVSKLWSRFITPVEDEIIEEPVEEITQREPEAQFSVNPDNIQSKITELETEGEFQQPAKKSIDFRSLVKPSGVGWLDQIWQQLPQLPQQPQDQLPPNEMEFLRQAKAKGLTNKEIWQALIQFRNIQKEPETNVVWAVAWTVALWWVAAWAVALSKSQQKAQALKTSQAIWRPKGELALDRIRQKVLWVSKWELTKPEFSRELKLKNQAFDELATEFGGKQVRFEDLDKIARKKWDTAIKQLDELLKSSTKTFGVDDLVQDIGWIKVNRVKQVLDNLLEVWTKAWQEKLFWQLANRETKLNKWTLTLDDINEIKRRFSKEWLFSKAWQELTSSTSEWRILIRKDLKEFIETAGSELKTVDWKGIKELNNVFAANKSVADDFAEQAAKALWGEDAVKWLRQFLVEWWEKVSPFRDFKPLKIFDKEWVKKINKLERDLWKNLAEFNKVRWTIPEWVTTNLDEIKWIKVLKSAPKGTVKWTVKSASKNLIKVVKKGKVKNFFKWFLKKWWRIFSLVEWWEIIPWTPLHIVNNAKTPDEWRKAVSSGEIKIENIPEDIRTLLWFI